MTVIEKRFVDCPECRSSFMVQNEWNDLGFGPQGEINRSEKWTCERCGKSIVILATYVMRSYRVGRSETGELEDASFDCLGMRGPFRLSGYL